VGPWCSMVQHTRVKVLHGEPGALAILGSNPSGPTTTKIIGKLQTDISDRSSKE
jgi:hypothetical protein